MSAIEMTLPKCAQKGKLGILIRHAPPGTIFGVTHRLRLLRLGLLRPLRALRVLRALGALFSRAAAAVRRRPLLPALPSVLLPLLPRRPGRRRCCKRRRGALKPALGHQSLGKTVSEMEFDSGDIREKAPEAI